MDPLEIVLVAFFVTLPLTVDAGGTIPSFGNL